MSMQDDKPSFSTSNQKQHFDWSRWLPTIICVAAVFCLILFLGNQNTSASNSEKPQKNTSQNVSKDSQHTQSNINQGNMNQSSTNQSSDKDQKNSWQNNVMNEEGLAPMLKAYDIKPSTIQSVTFLDSLSFAPESTVHLGTNAGSAVQGWVEWGNARADLYVAADGGINGKLCCEELFMDFTNMKHVNFNGAFHTDEAKSMKSMFNGCESLASVDLEILNTSQVENMFQMFRDCKSLSDLDVSYFDTSKVENMSCMFSTCTSLVELDLSNFNTAKVTNMSYMFSACKKLESVDTSSFNTSKVYDMSGMFQWCSMIQYVDVSSWDVSNVESYKGFMNDGYTVDGQPWEKLFR